MNKDFSLENFSYEVIKYLIRNDMDDEEIYHLAIKYGMLEQKSVTQQDIDNNVDMQGWMLIPGDNWAFMSNELKECVEND